MGIVDDEGTSKLKKTSYMREVILEHRLFEQINLQHGYLVNGIFRCAKKMVAWLASIALHQNPLPSRQV